MKTATSRRRGLRSQLLCLFAMTCCVTVVGLQAQAEAESVDSELLLLVDISQRGLNKSEFDQVMDGYAAALTSTQVLDSIQSGTYGRIAVSLMFYGNSVTQQVGIPWMSIGSSADAAQFAILARDLTKPFSAGSPSISDALQVAALSFGTETGGTDNGFESEVQLVEVASATTPTSGSPADAANARDGALASGVDLINAITLGNSAAAIEAYYASNVIGGEAGGVVATSNAVAIDGGLAGTFSDQMSDQVSAGATSSLSSVPEPSVAVGLIIGLTFLVIRRRRL